VPFQEILRQLLQSIPGSIGAVFLDREGESVDLWAERIFEIGPDGLRAIGAYSGIFLGNLQRICSQFSLGSLERLSIEFEHVRLLSCNLKEGYYLVVVVESGANEGVAWQQIRVCRERLLDEL
jgi:predicted regulator of Ras-like GTPase activity (Roadblock/LC7/MglB family)